MQIPEEHDKEKKTGELETPNLEWIFNKYLLSWCLNAALKNIYLQFLGWSGQKSKNEILLDGEKMFTKELSESAVKTAIENNLKRDT